MYCKCNAEDEYKRKPIHHRTEDRKGAKYWVCSMCGTWKKDYYTRTSVKKD